MNATYSSKCHPLSLKLPMSNPRPSHTQGTAILCKSLHISSTGNWGVNTVPSRHKLFKAAISSTSRPMHEPYIDGINHVHQPYRPINPIHQLYSIRQSIRYPRASQKQPNQQLCPIQQSIRRPGAASKQPYQLLYPIRQSIRRPGPPRTNEIQKNTRQLMTPTLEVIKEKYRGKKRRDTPNGSHSSQISGILLA